MKLSILTISTFMTTFVYSLTGCSLKVHDSAPLVANGVVVEHWEYPSVAHIEGAGMRCSATFIGYRLLLTAAHCIRKDSRTVKVHTSSPINKSAKLLESVKIFKNPKFSEPSSPADWREVARYDLAVIVLGEPGPESSSLYRGKIEVGDEVLLVGYGFATWPTTAGFGTKRRGSNIIQNIKNGVIEISGESTDESNSSGIYSTGTVGDSGGPLFKDSKIVGVTSWGGISEFEFGDNLNHMHYVNLTTIESRTFLKETIEAAQEIDKKIDIEF